MSDSHSSHISTTPSNRGQPVVHGILELVAKCTSSAQDAQCTINSTSEHSFQHSADTFRRKVLDFHLAGGSFLLKVVVFSLATAENFCCCQIFHQHQGLSRGHQTFLVQLLRNHPCLVMASIQNWVVFRHVLFRNMGGALLEATPMFAHSSNRRCVPITKLTRLIICSLLHCNHAE